MWGFCPFYADLWDSICICEKEVIFMKKAIILLLTAFMLFSTVGCTIPIDSLSSSKPTESSPSKPKETVFPIDSYHLQITADSTFSQNTGGSFDLQITNGSAYISIMAYKYIDLPTGLTPLDVLKKQNEDLFSKRNNVTTVEDVKTQSTSQQSITHALFSAERDGVKNYYASYLVDFPAEQTFAWVLVTATPSYFVENQEYLHNIVCSLTPYK